MRMEQHESGTKLTCRIICDLIANLTDSYLKLSFKSSLCTLAESNDTVISCSIIRTVHSIVLFRILQGTELSCSYNPDGLKKKRILCGGYHDYQRKARKDPEN